MRKRPIFSTDVLACAGVVAMLADGTTVAGEEILTLVLRVENHAGLSPEILGQAEEQATRIYEAIGVRTMWVHDGSPYPDLRTRHLSVLILSREMAERLISAGKLGDDVLGVSNPDTGRAHIFADRIAAIAAKKPRDITGVLGVVLAHEVGHMVLPPDSHSNTGLMRADLANLKMQAENLRHFTAAQGALIRAWLMASGAKENATPDLAPLR